MLRKIGRKITNNFGLKVLAALCAVVLWVVVVNIDDPIITKTYTTGIIFENQNYIASENKYFEVLDGNNTISFQISAKRTVHEKLMNTDFKANADMEKIEYDAERQTYQVPVVISQSKYPNDEVTVVSKKLYAEVALEDLGKVQKPIVAQTSGKVADGCALGSVEIIGSNIVKIQGPSSVVSQIDKVVAIINVDGMATDLTDSVVPIFYDADENVVDTTKLKTSINTVSINAKILNTKDVALEFATSGKPAEGYVATGISYTPNTTVRIKGEAEVLNPINKISIPAEVLDLTDLTDSIETTVDISSYLPEGTSLVLASDAKIAVKVTVEPIETKLLEIPVSNLTVGDLGAGYQAEFMTDTVLIEVSGARSVLEGLKEADIKGIADASGLNNGEHLLKVTFDSLGEFGCELTKPVQVLVNIKGSHNTGAGNTNAGNDSTNNEKTEDGSTENGTAAGGTDNVGDSDKPETNQAGSDAAGN